MRFKSFQDAGSAKHRLVHQLMSSAEPRAAALATTLSRCGRTSPCHSAACPVCGLAFQQAAVALVDEFIGGPARAIRQRMHATTIVPASGCVPPDDLTLEAVLNVKAEVAAAYARLELPPAIIGLEVSFNEDLTGAVEPHACIHGHEVGLDWLSETQVNGLRAAFPPSRSVKRPVKCEVLDQDIRGRRYPFKVERVRRVTDLVDDDPDRGPYRDTKPRPLRPWQAVTLALVEHRLGFGRRLQVHRIDRGAVRRHLRGLGWARAGP